MKNVMQHAEYEAGCGHRQRGQPCLHGEQGGRTLAASVAHTESLTSRTAHLHGGVKAPGQDARIRRRAALPDVSQQRHQAIPELEVTITG